MVNDHGSVTRSLTPEKFTDLAHHRVGVLARPGTRRVSWLASDLLRAFGCDPAVDGAGRLGEANLDTVVAWARAHDIEHLYVQNSWLLGPTILANLLDARAAIGCDLWLVGDTPLTQTLLDTLNDHAHAHSHPDPEQLEGHHFLERWSHLTRPYPGGARPGDATDAWNPSVPAGEAGAALRSPAWPTLLPRDDFVTFLASCRALLPSDQFTAVHAYFISCAAEATSLAAGLPAESAQRELELARWLHDQWEDIESWQHFVVLLRATQVALFHAGLLMRVDPDQVVATATTLPRRALRDPETWSRLAAYPEPHRGVVCALAAAGLTVAQMRELTVDDAAPAGDRVRVVNDHRTGQTMWVHLEDGASLYLRAQVVLLRQRGAGPTSPLLPAPQSGAPLAEPVLARLITTARRELGIAVAAKKLNRNPVIGSQWFTGWGIGVQDIPT